MKGDPAFDLVHDSQLIYREMLEAVSRPGTISNIKTVLTKLPDSPVNPGLIGMALTILDGETSFAVVPESSKLSSYIQQKTGSRVETLDQADYILMYDLSLVPSFSEVIETIKKGTLIDPHDSATLLIQVKSFSATNGAPYILSGPGIASEYQVPIEGLPENWEKTRQRAIKEFPLGIDFFFVSQAAEILSIPRTTRIRKA
ncbi:phosphonate C-P lyase system protein PhnH [Salibacterium aidingense]|uniref:phosphonate C-P lyase system protein PhnH n=1 Tax=Salibacterium aidingense TaxID=384933 RepID=UPI003BC48EA0